MSCCTCGSAFSMCASCREEQEFRDRLTALEDRFDTLSQWIKADPEQWVMRKDIVYVIGCAAKLELPPRCTAKHPFGGQCVKAADHKGIHQRGHYPAPDTKDYFL